MIDGLAFVVTPDDNKLHTLNAAATLLWTQAARPLSVDDAAAALVAAYDVDLDTAREDAARCIDDMMARTILVAVEA